MLFGFGLFNRAGATGHVFFVNNGKRHDKGIAYSGLVGPGTTIATVPTTQQILEFSVDALTQDKQNVTLNGNVKVTLNPSIAVTVFDFSVDSTNGTYLARWNDNLKALVMERVLSPIRAIAKTLTLEQIITAHAQVEQAIVNEIGAGKNALLEKGVTIDSGSILRIVPEDDSLSEALGAKERETLLTAADAATHERQMKSVENARAVKTYESQTQATLEKERGRLIAQQGKNRMAEAKVDAEATAERLKPFEATDSGKVFGAALLEMARSGRIGSINIAPDLLAALQQK